jgi:type II secretory pathway pseudopilin PulG
MTLVELLVIVAIISVLVAVLLPVVQTASAAARASSCTNNFKQIGLALLNYESANGTLPMSQTKGEGHGIGHSVFTAILPYLEQTRVYNGYNFSLENWHSANQTAVTTRIDTFLCPENKNVDSVPAAEVRFPESRSTFARTHLGANWGGGRGPWGEEFVKQKGTYLGVIMTVIDADGRVKGPGGRPPAHCVSLREITDGTSLTLAMVEKRDSFGWAVGGWGGSEFDVHISPAFEGEDPLVRKVYTGSYHEAGPGAILCDGSFRSLHPGIDRMIWYALITRAGGDLAKFEE